MISQLCISFLEDSVKPLNFISSHTNFTLDVLVLFSYVGVFLKFSGELADVEPELLNFSVFDFIGVSELFDF